MRTIVQEYGPIYGEPVNGTVLGRPNGSVFVPITNTMGLTIGDDFLYFRLRKAGDDWALRTCNSSGVDATDANRPKYVAVSQDLASNIQIQAYSDSELTTLVSYRDLPAGLFNMYVGDVWNTDHSVQIGDTLYLRAQLMNNGSPVATSEVYECEVVA